MHDLPPSATSRQNIVFLSSTSLIPRLVQNRCSKATDEVANRRLEFAQIQPPSKSKIRKAPIVVSVRVALIC